MWEVSDNFLMRRTALICSRMTVLTRLAVLGLVSGPAIGRGQFRSFQPSSKRSPRADIRAAIRRATPRPSLGLALFYGRNVFAAIEGRSTPGGAGPYFAF